MDPLKRLLHGSTHAPFSFAYAHESWNWQTPVQLLAAVLMKHLTKTRHMNLEGVQYQKSLLAQFIWVVMGLRSWVMLHLSRTRQVIQELLHLSTADSPHVDRAITSTLQSPWEMMLKKLKAHPLEKLGLIQRKGNWVRPKGRISTDSHK